MKKQDLKNGDIIVCESGAVGMVVFTERNSYIVYQQEGWDDLDNYSDDLIYEDADDPIMQVFRGIYSFNEITEDLPIYERDENWLSPQQIELNRELDEIEARQAAEAASKKNNGFITVIAQAFYGNRTGTDIHRERIDSFILGHLSDDYPVDEPIDRTIIHLPGSENLVLIYNKYQEEEWLERKEEALVKDNYVMKPLATIPEMNLEIYSRCIVCRMNESGELESLGKGDFDIWGKYLAN